MLAGRNTLYTHVSELTFKRTVSASGMRGAAVKAALYVCRSRTMDIYIFSDESGVFDREHNDFFVFGGIMLLSKDERDVCARKYLHAERTLRNNGKYAGVQELKATFISNKDKGKLFRALSQYQRFGIVIDQKQLLSRIFNSKKDKQRYLDFAYKIGLKRLFETLIEDGTIPADGVRNIIVCVDEHTTATNGRYELREALEQEFKFGTYNATYSKHFPPIFENLHDVSVNFCNSEKKTLIRAADIIANRLYHLACNNPDDLYEHGIFIIRLPQSLQQ